MKNAAQNDSNIKFMQDDCITVIRALVELGSGGLMPVPFSNLETSLTLYSKIAQVHAKVWTIIPISKASLYCNAHRGLGLPPLTILISQDGSNAPEVNSNFLKFELKLLLEAGFRDLSPGVFLGTAKSEELVSHVAHARFKFLYR